MDKAARYELLREVKFMSQDAILAELRTIFAEYDALEEKHRLCGTKIAAQKGIVQGVRHQLDVIRAAVEAERERWFTWMRGSRGGCGKPVGECGPCQILNVLEAAMREGE